MEHMCDILINKQNNVTEAAVKEHYQFTAAMDFVLGRFNETDAEKHRQSEIYLMRAHKELDESTRENDRKLHNDLKEMREICKRLNKTCTEYFEKKDDSFSVVQYQRRRFKDADDNRTSANASLLIDHETIRKLQRDIRRALQETSRLNEDIIRIDGYLIKLQKQCGAQPVYRGTICWIMVIAIIWVIAKSDTKQTQQHEASNDNENEWQCLNQLLSRNHANIRMADLRKIINKYQDKLDHIKTAGRGRTKIKIICELRAFQNANAV